jgi:hypothetical protein
MYSPCSDTRGLSPISLECPTHFNKVQASSGFLRHVEIVSRLTILCLVAAEIRRA